MGEASWSWREVLLPISSLGLRRGVLLTSPWGLWKGQDRFRKTQMAGSTSPGGTSGRGTAVGVSSEDRCGPSIGRGPELKVPFKRTHMGFLKATENMAHGLQGMTLAVWTAIPLTHYAPSQLPQKTCPRPGSGGRWNTLPGLQDDVFLRVFAGGSVVKTPPARARD